MSNTHRHVAKPDLSSLTRKLMTEKNRSGYSCFKVWFDLQREKHRKQSSEKSFLYARARYRRISKCWKNFWLFCQFLPSSVFCFMPWCYTTARMFMLIFQLFLARCWKETKHSPGNYKTIYRCLKSVRKPQGCLQTGPWSPALKPHQNLWGLSMWSLIPNGH